MAFNLNDLIDSIGRFSRQHQPLLGAGLIAGGALSSQEPGTSVEARQFLRNQFTSPDAFPTLLGQNLSALEPLYRGAFQQQTKNLLDEIQQRVVAGQPASLTPAMGGPEISAIRSGVTDILKPREEAFLTNLALNQIQNQLGSAGTLLEYSRPDPFADALSKLGTILMLGGQGGGQNAFASTGGFQNILGQLASGGGGGGGSGGSLPISSSPAMHQVMTALLHSPVAGDSTALQNLLASGVFGGGTASLGGGGTVSGLPTGALLPGGTTIGANQLGNVVALPGGGSVTFGGGGGGALGTVAGDAPLSMAGLSGALGALGAGAAGFGTGHVLGGRIQTPTSRGETVKAAAAGSTTGAAEGAVIGSIVPGLGTAIGAIIGGVAGAAGGISGQHKQSLAIKAERHAADLQASNSNIHTTAAFWMSALGQAGAETDGFRSWIDQLTAGYGGGDVDFSFGGVSGHGHPQDDIARAGGHLLLQQIQKTRPDITSLDQVPGLRTSYVNWLLNNYRIESGGQVVGVGGNIQDFGQLVTEVGFPLAR